MVPPYLVGCADADPSDPSATAAAARMQPTRMPNYRSKRATGVRSATVQACTACGVENADGNRFCGSCGAALTVPGVERRKLVTSVFCDLSGSTALAEQVEAETVY